MANEWELQGRDEEVDSELTDIANRERWLNSVRFRVRVKVRAKPRVNEG